MFKKLIIGTMVLGTSLFATSTFDKTAEMLNENILVKDMTKEEINKFFEQDRPVIPTVLKEYLDEKYEIAEFKTNNAKEFDLFVHFFLDNVKYEDKYITNCSANNKKIHNNDFTLMINRSEPKDFGVYRTNVSLDFIVEPNLNDYKIVNYCFMDNEEFKRFEEIERMIIKR